jgi:hypothetical protein
MFFPLQNEVKEKATTKAALKNNLVKYLLIFSASGFGSENKAKKKNNIT